MAVTTIFDKPRSALFYHPQEKVVHHQIKKFLQGDELHELLLGGTQQLKLNHAQKWLSDDRGMPVLSKEDIQWAQTVWFPQTLQAGWKYWAIVQPEKMIAQMNMADLVKLYASLGITAKFFSNPEDAMTWLVQQGTKVGVPA